MSAPTTINIPEEVTREDYETLAKLYNDALYRLQESATRNVLLTNRNNDLEREIEEVNKRYEVIELREKNTRMKVIELLGKDK